MELIVTSFLLTALSLFGHMATVIAERFRPPQRRVFRVPNDFHEPPPYKRAPIYSLARPAEAAVLN